MLILHPDGDDDGMSDQADNCTEIQNPVRIDTDVGLRGGCDCDFDNKRACSINDFDTFLTVSSVGRTAAQAPE